MLMLSAPLFGSKHIIGVVGVLILAIAASIIVFNSKSDLKSRKAILVFMSIFYAMELIKLSYITYIDGSFPIYQLPFHLCSLPLYLYPLIYFLRPGRFVERYIKPAAYSVVMLAGIMALALPTNILGDSLGWLPFKENFLPILSFVYHGTMIFSSIYLLKSGLYSFQKGDSLRAISVSITFAGMAMAANALLDKDFMLLNYGNGSPLQFINEYSHFLYVMSMIGLAIILIFLSFAITKALVNTRNMAHCAKAYTK